MGDVLAQAKCPASRRQDSFVEVRQILAVVIFCFSIAALVAFPVPAGSPTGYPSWWFSRGVIVPSNPTNGSPHWPADYPASDDYAVINQGQLKNLATAAYAELQAYAPTNVWSTSAGTNLTAFVTGLSTTSTNTDNYAVANLGQLKTVAQPFYNVLAQVGYTSQVPWTGTGADDYSAANLGQVKNVFSFDLAPLVLSIPSGNYTSAQTVTITGAVGDQYYYTTDGSNPTSASNLYSSSIPVSATETINVQAYHNGNPIGGVVSATYTFPPPAPPFINSSNSAAGTLGTALSYTITANNSPASYEAIGLPDGLSINTTTGVISGTPTAAGVFTVMLTAANSAGIGTADLTMTIAESSESAVTATGNVGSQFSYTPSPSLPVTTTYAITGSQALPAGLALDSASGEIVGTPTTAGTTTVTLSTTAGGTSSSRSVTLTITSGEVGQPFGQSVATNNIFAETGTLPAGLSFNSVTGEISGVPTTAGSYPITLTASTSAGPITISLGLTISSGPPITSSSSITGTVGAALNYSILSDSSATSFGASNLPPGLQVNPFTGIISGTPSAAGTFVSQLSATDFNGTSNLSATFTITGGSPIPYITSPAILYVTQGQSFSYTISAANSPTSYSATMAGGFPSSVTFNTSTGVISGEFANVGTPNILLGATNSYGEGTLKLIIVVGSSTNSIAITNLSLQDGVSPTSIYVTTSATIGENSGSSGIPYDGSGGVIDVGVPAASTVARALVGFDLSVLPIGSTITSASLVLNEQADPTAGSLAYPVEIHAAGGPFSPNLASWAANSGYNSTVLSSVSLADSTSAGSVTFPSSSDFDSAVQGAYNAGTSLYLMLVSPTAEGSTASPSPNFSFQSETSSTTANRPNLVLNVSTAAPPLIQHAAIVYGTAGSSYSDQIKAMTATSYSLNISPTLSDLTINATTGVISGNLSVADVGTYTVTVSASNGNGTGTNTYTLNVGQIPSITSSTTANGVVGLAFSYTITGSNTPTSFTSDDLPEGLTLNSSTGVISGTPEDDGAFSFNVYATNAYGTTSTTITFNIAVGTPVMVPQTGVSGNVGAYFDVTAGWVSNDPGYEDSYVATLPDGLSGLSCTPQSGELSGTPTTAGTFTFTMTATNPNGQSASESSQVTILSAPSVVVPALTVYGIVGESVGQYYPPQNVSFSGLGTATQLSAYPSGYSMTSAPDGVSVDSDGNFDGSPNASGVFNAALTAYVPYGTPSCVSGTGTVTFNIAASPPGLVLPTPQFPAIVGNVFNYSFHTINGHTATFVVTGLPSGLQYAPGTDQTTGTITGTPIMATPAGTPASVTIQATDTTNPSNITTQTLSLPVTAPLTGTVGVNFSSSALPNDGTTTFTLLGNAPAGLSFNTTTGVISGTPTTAGIYLVTMTAYDSAPYSYTQEKYQIAIAPAATDSVIDFQEGVSPQPTYAAPALSIGTDTSNTNEANEPLTASSTLFVGQMSTTETRRGLLSFDLSAIPAGATITSATLVLTPVLGSSAGVPMDVDVYEMTSNFDAASADWALNGSPLATELASTTLNPSAVSATTSLVGFPQFATAVQNDLSAGKINLMLLSLEAESQSSPIADYMGFVGHGSTAAQNPELIVTYQLASVAPAITSPTIAWGTVGQPLSYSIISNAAGCLFSAPGLPSGLGLNSTTGVVSGTPAVVGSTAVTIGASNPEGSASQTVVFNVDSVTPATALSITSGNNQAAVAGTFAAQPLTVNATNGGVADAGCLVTFTCAPGNGSLATSLGSTSVSASLTVKTDSSGNAAAYLLLPQNIKPVMVTASAGSASPAIFNATSVTSLSTASGSQGDLPVLSILSGGGSATSGTPSAVVIQATNHEDLPWVSLPLTLTTSGGTTISSSAGGGFGTTLSLTTGSNGQATFYLQPQSTAGALNVLSCTATPAGASSVTTTINIATAGVSGTPTPGGSAVIGTDPTPVTGNGKASVALSGSTATISVAGVGNYLLEVSQDNGPYTLLRTVPGGGTVEEAVDPGSIYNYELVTIAPSGMESSPYEASSLKVPSMVTGQIMAYVEGGSPNAISLNSSEKPVINGGSPSAGPFGNGYYYCNYNGEYPGYNGICGNQFLATGSGEFTFRVIGYNSVSQYVGLNQTIPVDLSTGAYTPVNTGNKISQLQDDSIYFFGDDHGYLSSPSVSDREKLAGTATITGLVTINATLPSLLSGSSVVWNWSGGGFVVNGMRGLAPSSVTRTSIQVVPDPNSPPSDGSVFSAVATFETNNGTVTLNSDRISFTYHAPQPDFSMPIDECSGAKYRKIALNGLPLTDDKPQQAPESDQEAEQTFVDALTMGLRHSTTDVYLPIPGSDLTVSARRDFRSEVWNNGNGLRPHEKWDEPFGACWSSNLAPAIRFDSTANVVSNPPKAYITDESGGVHTFYEVAGGFFPMPTSKNEQTPNLESLTVNYATNPPQYIFSRKYGMTLTFVTCGTEPIPQNRLINNGTLQVTTYAHLIQAVDRLGNTVLYHFSAPQNIVPDTISVLNHPDLKMSIAQDSCGHITSIWDANGNETKYTYTSMAIQGDANSMTDTGYETVLSSVTTPDGKITSYTYNFGTEIDQMPGPDVSKVLYLYGDLASIADPLGNKYQFSYAFDHTKLNYMKNPSVYTGYYIQSGVPRDLVGITLPDGSSTQLQNQSLTYLYQVGSVLTPGGQRQTQVTDATGFVRTYRYGSPQVFAMPHVGTQLGESVTQSNIVVYDTLAIDNGSSANGTYIGTETFQFDPNAAMALSQVTDLSGNATKYAHTDIWTDTGTIYALVVNFSGLNGFYGDPTLETNALGGTKTFTYTAGSRIMDSVIDENGNKTVYQIDSLGRRTKETICPSGSTTPIQVTDFVYGNDQYPGFMTQKTVEKLGGSDPSWTTSLVTQYVPDSDGRLAQEIVDPSGLALVTSYTYDANGNKLSTTDPRGWTTWFNYDNRNRLISVTNPDGSQKRDSYDADGNKLAEYDENGNATLYQYDALNRLITQARDLDGSGTIGSRSQDLITTYTYNAVNSKLTTTSPLSGITTYTYDGLQRVTKLTDPLGHSMTFNYGANSGGDIFDSSGFKPTQAVDARGYITTIVYDGLYRTTSKSVHYDTTGDVSTTQTAYDAVGNATSTTDPLSRVTQTAYDGLNRPTVVTYADSSTSSTSYASTGFKYQTKDENGNITQYQYDAAGRLTETIDPSVTNAATNTSANPTTRTIYDESGDVVATINPLGNEWDYTFDACNRKIQEIEPAAANGPGGTLTRAVMQWNYDAAGRTIAVIDAKGQETDTRYDRANRVTQVQQPAVLLAGTSTRPTVTTTYDADGNVLTLTDPNSHTTTNTYDLLSRLLTTTDAARITVTNAYDQVGNKLSVKDGKNQTTAFAYDGLNRNSTNTDPAGNVTTLNYNALNKTSRVDALSQTTSYTYDVRERLSGVTYSTSNATNSPRTYSYDSDGNLLSVTESLQTNANVAYTYDALNRVLTETSNGIVSTYGYDQAGNRLQTTYDSANTSTKTVITSTYDALNRLSTLVEGTRTSSYAYDLNGNIVQKVSPNGDTDTETYDAINRMVTQSGYAGSANGGGLLYGFTYGYDLTGNLTSEGESYPSGLSNRTVTNGYDTINRLTSEAVTGSAPNTTTTYQYDAANNRTETDVTGSSTSTTTYSYNNLNQLTSLTTGGATTSYTYDADGNRSTRSVGGATDTYGYDFDNRLVSLSKNTSGGSGTYSYQYDYRTRRITRVESGVTTALVFSGGTSVREYNSTASGAPTVQNIRGSDYGGGVGGILYTLRSGTPSYTHANERGDIVAKTDGTGALTYQAQYEGFGKQIATSGSTLDRQKSNSKDTDPTGLVDEGHRYRDLETGSFITRDPMGMINGPNEYTYVNQNPWTHDDPEGLFVGLVLAGGFQLYDSFEHATGGETNQQYAINTTLNAASVAVDLSDGELGGGELATELVGRGLTKAATKALVKDAENKGAAIGAADAAGHMATAATQPASGGNGSASEGGSSSAGGPPEGSDRETKKVPNPDGSKGKADHQQAVNDLVKEKQSQYPDHDVQSNTSIKGDTGVNRKPDVTVRDKNGNVVEVGEVARTNKDGTIVSREQKKQDEYKKAGIKSTVKKLPPSQGGG